MAGGLGVLFEGGAAAANHLGQTLMATPYPRWGQDVDHPADVARAADDQKCVRERREPIAVIAFE